MGKEFEPAGLAFSQFVSHAVYIHQAHATRSLFYDNLRTFRQECRPQMHVEIFDGRFEMEIVKEKGTSGMRLIHARVANGFVRSTSPCYAPQTKILENETAGWACLFE